MNDPQIKQPVTKDYSILFHAALDIANVAHIRQTTKDGLPYILHPIHVAMQVGSMRQKIVALLHDAIEDAAPENRNWVAREIRTMGDGIYDDVVSLTRDKGIDYQDYIDHLVRTGSDDAIMVKLADLEHNMDLSRLPEITDKDLARNEKYAGVFGRLSDEMNAR